MVDISSYKIAFKNNIYLITIVIVGLISSLPHFYTGNIWDGVLHEYAFEHGDYNTIYQIHKNSFYLSYFLVSLDKIRTLIGMNVVSFFNVCTSITIVSFSLGFYIFQIYALKIEKKTACFISIIFLALPIFTLLNSSIFITVLLNIILIFFSLGFFFSDRIFLKYLSIIGLFFVSTFPLYIPFILGLIFLSFLQQSFINIKSISFKDKVLILIPLFTGYLYYAISTSDLSAGYRYYGTYENIIYSARMFYEYFLPNIILFLVPIFGITLSFFKDKRYFILLILSFLILYIVSIIPYILYNKQPLCVIDHNCKENIYDWRERHAMLLYFALAITSSVSINLFTIIGKKISIIFKSIVFIMIFCNLIPLYLLNNHRNIIRDTWLNNLTQNIVELPKKYNFIQILLPNDVTLYKIRSYELQYFVYKSGISNIIISSNLVDNRVPDKRHKDYFIVPENPIFDEKVNEIENRYKKNEFGSVKNFINNVNLPLCGARYVLKSGNEDLSKYFNMRIKNYFNLNISESLKNESLFELVDESTGC